MIRIDTADGIRHWLAHWEMIIIGSASLAIATFSPDDVMTKYPLVGMFVEIVTEWVPPVVGYQRVSDFPQVTGLYFSVMFCVTPLIVPYLFKRRRTVLKGMEEKYKKSKGKFLVLGVAVSILFFCAPLLFYRFIVDGGELIPILPIRSSKMSMALLGWCAAGGAAWTFFSFAVWVMSFILKKVLIAMRRF